MIRMTFKWIYVGYDILMGIKQTAFSSHTDHEFAFWACPRCRRQLVSARRWPLVVFQSDFRSHYTSGGTFDSNGSWFESVF